MDTIILLICSNLLWLTFLLGGFESHSLGPFNVIVKRIIIITSNFIFGTDLQSSDDDGVYVRPKRVKSVPCISFRFQDFINIILIHRCLTEHDRQ